MSPGLTKFATRAGTTVAGSLFVCAIVLLLPKPFFHLALMGFGVLGVFEMGQMVSSLDLKIVRFPVFFTLAYGIGSLYLDPLPMDWLPYLVVTLTCLLRLPSKRPMGKALPEIGVTLACCAYLGLALIGLAFIFNLSDDSGDLLGRLLVLFCIFMVWAGDSAAYVVGTFLGKHKISPQISPNKTIEGTTANLLGNIGAAWVAKLTFFPELRMVDVILLGLVFGVLGFLGDLVESAWKRGGSVKDSGTIFPGHGGVMDRIDSIFLTAPVFYVYMLWLYRGSCIA